jgi:hypothetical protein
MSSIHKVRKQFILEPAKINRVKALVGARTETEAIDRAMDIVIINGQIRKVLQAAKGKGTVRDVYGRTAR